MVSAISYLILMHPLHPIFQNLLLLSAIFHMDYYNIVWEITLYGLALQKLHENHYQLADRRYGFNCKHVSNMNLMCLVSVSLTVLGIMTAALTRKEMTPLPVYLVSPLTVVGLSFPLFESLFCYLCVGVFGLSLGSNAFSNFSVFCVDWNVCRFLL